MNGNVGKTQSVTLMNKLIEWHWPSHEQLAHHGRGALPHILLWNHHETNPRYNGWKCRENSVSHDHEPINHQNCEHRQPDGIIEAPWLVNGAHGAS
eukprot:SAG25_NODE_845_length_5085_cov_16.777978_11_plen_96_part_00